MRGGAGASVRLALEIQIAFQLILRIPIANLVCSTQERILLCPTTS